MLSPFGKIIINQNLLSQLSTLNTGLEVEMNRVSTNGKISLKPYPKKLGQQITNPWITNDYLESMSEVVTPVAKNELDALQYLYGLNTVLRDALEDGELLWPFSMPPILPKIKTKALLAKASPAKEKYFQQIFEKHGLAFGAICGVHVNLSVKEKVLDVLYQALKPQFISKAELKDQLYVQILQGFMRYRWLLTYLFGASPLAEANYFKPGHKLSHPVRSIRQSSKYGFFSPIKGDYTNVQRYAQKILDAVKHRQLFKGVEFHDATRLKENPDLHQLPKEGVKYIELWMLDLDPSTPIGICHETLRFFRLLTLYFIMTPAVSAEQVNSMIAQADQKHEAVAIEHPLEKCAYYDEGIQFLHQLRHFASRFQVGPDLQETLLDMEARLNHPALTPSGRLVKHIQNHSLLNYGLHLAKDYQTYAEETDNKYRGFEEKKGLVSAAELKQNLLIGKWNFD